MKYQYKEMPESMKGTYGEFAKNFGFDWKEFIMGIPTPMFLVTTYKSNGQRNAKAVTNSSLSACCDSTFYRKSKKERENDSRSFC